VVKRSFILVITIFSFFTCVKEPKKHQVENGVSLIDKKVDSFSALNKESTLPNLTPKQEDSAYISTLNQVFGYRFEIEGDFNGDGKNENLKEHFYDLKTNSETNKFYDSIGYDILVAITVMHKKPYSFLLSDNNKIDTLRVTKSGQQLGLSFLKNEGDLDRDGGDEISYVVNWADWSNMNTCHIMSYKNKEWIELYSFEIWDWQLPNLPETVNLYGPVGLSNKIINKKSDTVNKQIVSEFENFPGLIEKVEKNKIKVHKQNLELGYVETIVVELNN
jgi:hypothetical protein